jgi:hypothetical protein
MSDVTKAGHRDYGGYFRKGNIKKGRVIEILILFDDPDDDSNGGISLLYLLGLLYLLLEKILHIMND